MGLKEKLQQKIEENTVRSELTWTDKKGNSHTEEVLLKRSRVPILGDWGRIYPPINEDGSMNWINWIFGGYKNLIKLSIVLGIAGMVLWQFKVNFAHVDYIKNLPCVQVCLDSIKEAPSLLG